MIRLSSVYEKARKALALTIAFGLCLQPITVYAENNVEVPDTSYVEIAGQEGAGSESAGDVDLAGSDIDTSGDTDLPGSDIDTSGDTDLSGSDPDTEGDVNEAGTDLEAVSGDGQKAELDDISDAETVAGDAIVAGSEADTDADTDTDSNSDTDADTDTDSDTGTDTATDTDTDADILSPDGLENNTPEGDSESVNADTEVLLNSAADVADNTLEPSGEAMPEKEAVLGSLLTSTDNKETVVNDGTETSDDDIYSVVPSFVVLGLEPEPSKEAESGDGSGDISSKIGSGSFEPQGPSARDTVVDDSGLDLRVGQYSVIDEYLSKPAKEFNQKLAELCADLSYDAYNKDDAARLLKSVGFEESNIHSYNYGYTEIFAYTLAVKDYTGADSDGKTKVLVMDARGTSGVRELWWDVESVPTVDYEGLPHKVHTAADAFYKAIAPNVSSLIKDDTNYKILATGHSLGGAAANLFSAVMMQKENTDVYCYTYGAIDSIGPVTEKKSVTEGYENIHNIYNDLDTFSPTQYGYYMKGSGKNDGAGQKYGKFGHMDSYTVEHRTKAQQQQNEYLQVYNAINHQIGNYITDIKAEKVKCVRKHDDDYDDDEYDDEYEDEDYEPDDEGDKQLVPIDLEEEEDFEGLDALDSSDYEAFAGDNTSGFLIDDDKTFQDTVDFWKDLKQATVLYNSGDVKLDRNISIRSINSLKGSDGETVVMMEIVNNSDKPISLAYKSVLVNGKRVSLAPWKSGVIPPEKRMFVAIPLSKYVNIGSRVSIPVCIYSTDGKKLVKGTKLTVVDR